MFLNLELNRTDLVAAVVETLNYDEITRMILDIDLMVADFDFTKNLIDTLQNSLDEDGFQED